MPIFSNIAMISGYSICFGQHILISTTRLQKPEPKAVISHNELLCFTLYIPAQQKCVDTEVVNTTRPFYTLFEEG